MMEWNKTQQWLDNQGYLPSFMRDFHNQKDLFKAMHYLYEQQDDDVTAGKPNWVDGHTYTIDWFLWYMASRGYTLQKTRKKLIFREFENWRLMKKGED